MTCQKAVPRPHFHATGSNVAWPKCWRLVCRSSSSRTNILRYLRAPRAVSSVGSEHLVYTEGVGGSSPSPPTQNKAQKAPARKGLFVAQTRAKLACGRKRTVISFGATPQCFQEHHEGRHPPQTNCRPPKPRLLSHHARGRHPVLPMESP